MVNISTHPTNTPQLTPDPITIPSSPIARRRKIVQLGGYVHFVLYSSSRNPAESVQPYSRSFSKGKAHFPISFHLARHYQRLKRCYCRRRRPPLYVHSPCIPCYLFEKQDLDRPRPSSRGGARQRCQIRKHQDHGRICSNDFRFHVSNTRDQVETIGEGIPQDCSRSFRKSPQFHQVRQGNRLVQTSISSWRRCTH